jgi:hypothetical protein
MKQIKIGSKLKINNLIGVVLKKENHYALIKFDCGQFVYKILGFEEKNIL